MYGAVYGPGWEVYGAVYGPGWEVYGAVYGPGWEVYGAVYGPGWEVYGAVYGPGWEVYGAVYGPGWEVYGAGDTNIFTMNMPTSTSPRKALLRRCNVYNTIKSIPTLGVQVSCCVIIPALDDRSRAGPSGSPLT